MAKIKFLILHLLTFLLTIEYANGQSNLLEINKVTKAIDSIVLSTDTFSLQLDNAFVTIKYNPIKIETNSNFSSIKKPIKINFYFKDTSLIYVWILECNRYFPERFVITEYYYSKDKIIKQMFRQAESLGCITYQRDEILKIADCSSNLGDETRKLYLQKLLSEIKRKYRNYRIEGSNT